MGLTCWATLGGVPVGDGPILTCLGGQVVLTEIGQFSNSSLQFAASDERAILAMQPYTILEVVQDGVGTLTAGYVLNPRQQITAQDEHTLTLDLSPLAVECTWRRLHRGWQAINTIGVVAGRLGAFTPGWSGVFLDAGTAADITVSETLNDQTPLQGFLNVGKDFDQRVRQGVDATGAPTRVLEMGQMGAAPAVTLVGANGGDAALMRDNPLIRLVATVDYQPNDVSSLVNVCTPFGGGSTTDTVVTLERLWRILNDRTYPNFGRYGSDAASIARTGKVSVFPEYDPAYPISDPDNPPTGAATFVGGQLSQGAVGTRYFTVDGHSDYMVYDAASLALYGHKEGQFVDSGLTYTDPSPANQELTERALYIETIANFKKFAHPHHLFSCTTNDASSRPTRAGDLIALDYQRVGTGDDGAVVEMNVVDTLRVMSVTRTFTPPSGSTETPPTDTYLLSNLGRFDETDATQAATQAATMVALQINQGTSLAPMTVNDRGNVDALHPLVTHVSVPKQLFRWQRCNLRVDFMPYTGTSTTAENVAGTPIEFDVPHGAHTLAGAGVTDAGLAGTTDGFDLVQTGVDNDAVVKITINNDGGNLPIGQRLNAQLLTNQGSVGAAWRLSSGAVPDGTPLGANMKINFVKAKTKSAFTAALNKAVSVAANLTATLPVHVHPLDQQIPNGPLPASCLVDINGASLSSGLTLLSGARDTSGAFTSAFEVDDVSAILNGIAGDLTITLHAGTSASNPLGVGMFLLSCTWFGEFGGLAATAGIAQ